MRGLLSFCANYAKIIKVHSLINKVTLKGQKKTIKLISKRSMIFSDFVQVTLSNLEDHFFPTHP